MKLNTICINFDQEIKKLNFRNPTLPVVVYSLEKQTVKFHLDMIWNDWALDLVKEVALTRRRTTKDE